MKEAVKIKKIPAPYLSNSTIYFVIIINQGL